MKQVVVCLTCKWRGQAKDTVKWNPKKEIPPHCPKCDSTMLIYPGPDS